MKKNFNYDDNIRLRHEKQSKSYIFLTLCHIVGIKMHWNRICHMALEIEVGEQIRSIK